MKKMEWEIAILYETSIELLNWISPLEFTSENYVSIFSFISFFFIYRLFFIRYSISIRAIAFHFVSTETEFTFGIYVTKHLKWFEQAFYADRMDPVHNLLMLCGIFFCFLFFSNISIFTLLLSGLVKWKVHRMNKI